MLRISTVEPQHPAAKLHRIPRKSAAFALPSPADHAKVPPLPTPVMPTQRILVADPIAEAGIAALQSEPSFEVDVKIGIAPADLLASADRYDAIVVRSQTTIGAEVIAAATRLKAVGRAGVGVDNIDVAAATARGVLVMNTPGGNTISTAEHAFTLMTALARRIPQAHASVSGGRWERKKFVGTELNGKQLTILGMGRIGSEFAKRALAFDMKVVAYDPYLSANRARNLRVELAESIEDAIARADFITLHMPLTDETRHMLDARRLGLCKKGVHIINCARGGLVSEAALLEGLESGQVAGAALDVFETEPPPADHPLLGRPDVVFTPHLGASTTEAQENVGIEIAEVLADHLKTGRIRNAVNMPSIDPETLALVGPYLGLAESLGRVLAEISPNQNEKFTVSYRGRLAEGDTTLITRAALKGFIEDAWGETSVNYINAPAHARDLGLEVAESKLADKGEYTELIELTSRCGGTEHRIAGCFFGEAPRIVRIDERRVEVPAEGTLLLIENRDTPGIVGQLGTALAAQGVNIANMSLARDAAGGTALTVIATDGEPNQELLADLRGRAEILSARAVALG